MALFNHEPTFTPPTTGPVPTPVAPAVNSLPPLTAAQSVSAEPAPAVRSAATLPTSSGASSALPPLGAPAAAPVQSAPSLPPLGASQAAQSGASSVLPPLSGSQSVGITPTITPGIEPNFGEISSQYKPAVLEVTSPGGLLPGMLPLSGKTSSSPISATGGLTGTWSSTGVTDPFHPYGLDGMNGLLPMSTPTESASSLPALLPILPTKNTPVIQIFRNDDGNYTAKHITKQKESRGITEYEAFMNLLTLIG